MLYITLKHGYNIPINKKIPIVREVAKPPTDTNIDTRTIEVAWNNYILIHFLLKINGIL